MQTKVVNENEIESKSERRGPPTKYQEIYDQVESLPDGKALEVECDSAKQARKVSAAVRHRYPAKQRGKIIEIKKNKQ